MRVDPMIRIQLEQHKSYDQGKSTFFYKGGTTVDTHTFHLNLGQARQLWRAIGKELKEAKERQQE